MQRREPDLDQDRAASTDALVHAALLVLGALFVGAALLYVNDGDLSWQRALGDYVLSAHALPATLGPATFSAPNAHWVPHEWIFATFWALAQRANLELAFRLGCAGIAGATLLVAVVRARPSTSLAQIIACGLVVASLLPGFGARAQIVAWPLLALMMVALESARQRPWSIVALTIVWFNVHASAVMIPAIVIADAAGRALTHRRSQPLVDGALLAVTCTLAAALTPFGWSIVPFAVGWALNPATRLIAEWQPITLQTLPYCSATFVIAAILVVGEFRGIRLTWSQRLIGAFFLCAAILHVRNVALFGIVAGPWVATVLSQPLPAAPRPHPVSRKSDHGLVALGAIGAVIITATAAMMRTTATSDPTAAVDRIVKDHRERRVACEDFSWCSRFAKSPQIGVLLDGRLDAYPSAVFADFRRLTAGDGASVLDRWHIDTVLARRDGPLADSLRAHHWRTIDTGETAVFVRV